MEAQTWNITQIKTYSRPEKLTNDVRTTILKRGNWFGPQLWYDIPSPGTREKLPKAGLFTKLAFPWNCRAGPRTEVEIVKTSNLTLTQIWRVPKTHACHRVHLWWPHGSTCNYSVASFPLCAPGRRRLHNDSTRLYSNAVLHCSVLPLLTGAQR